jgi:uncharacterized integral membrane protein
MLSKDQSTPVRPPPSESAAETVAAPADDGSPMDAAAAPADASPVVDRETRRERSRRKAHRSRLHVYAVLAVVLVAFLIALAVSNTAAVKVNWLFGSSHVSLVWMVLFAAVLGWVLGLVLTAAFHWRTRAPRRTRSSRRTRAPRSAGGAS